MRKTLRPAPPPARTAAELREYPAICGRGQCSTRLRSAASVFHRPAASCPARPGHRGARAWRRTNGRISCSSSPISCVPTISAAMATRSCARPPSTRWPRRASSPTASMSPRPSACPTGPASLTGRMPSLPRRAPQRHPAVAPRHQLRRAAAPGRLPHRPRRQVASPEHDRQSAALAARPGPAASRTRRWRTTAAATTRNGSRYWRDRPDHDVELPFYGFEHGASDGRSRRRHRGPLPPLAARAASPTATA